MAVERTVLSGGVRLAVHDHSGTGRPVVLLHGLAGHSGEWDATAAWMSERHRVIAVDQRGQGASERHPADVSRAAYVADVIAVIEVPYGDRAGHGSSMHGHPEPRPTEARTGHTACRNTDDGGPEPVVLVGQSLGGHTAMLVAAARPDLVRALVMVEASPGLPDAGGVAGVERWLASWPVPFPSPAAAARFFGGGAAGAGWAAGLEEREDGWWPRFDPALMVRSLTDASPRSFWREWEQVACPTLVVLAESGIIPSVDADEMRRTRPDTVMAHIPGAGHDVHLEAPGLLRAAIEDFLEAR
ncbi:alpha/beta hydrolase [Actinoallomurus bryophytorum]|uniref:Pimeloyl-ACP methyl ester carboxylesterase n=1 Tax=Actinoallomurus bryophytorum TaxID=1490222 RepID=A0A543BTD3_9ACTN|nr:alpha/beta hydrolase [Actinoallomurus bryophytorum]TQL88082.1 pimeloyl-ACP methyl ester carboxylesterase [Actinoallomurus bryophytorum]